MSTVLGTSSNVYMGFTASTVRSVLIVLQSCLKLLLFERMVTVFEPVDSKHLRHRSSDDSRLLRAFGTTRHEVANVNSRKEISARAQHMEALPAIKHKLCLVAKWEGKIEWHRLGSEAVLIRSPAFHEATVGFNRRARSLRSRVHKVQPATTGVCD